MNYTIPPLFRRYPDLAERIPWIPLGSYPTRVHRLDCCSPADLWIKREDESSFLYGGNKVRKLEFILADAEKSGKKMIVTMGGLGTNHGLATAIFCLERGLACRLLLFDQPVNDHVRRNLLLFSRYGAEPVYIGGMLATGLRFFTFERLRFPHAYFLPAGGSSPVGILGVVSALFELGEQVRDGIIPCPRYIICPLGSGGTLAGLALGVLLAGLETEVIGVLVTVKRTNCYPIATPRTVRKLMGDTLNVLRRHSSRVPRVKITSPVIMEGYLGDGYGCDTDACRDAMTFMKEQGGVDLDPTYTGKTFAAVRDFTAKKTAADGPILYWHTYNSVDLSSSIRNIDGRSLPGPLRRFFSENP